jgi:polyhydroxybutyrate depolymerase
MIFMKKKFLILLISFFLCLTIVLSGCISRTDYIVHDGQKRFFNVHLPYKIYLPSSYNSSESYPLVFVFHGGGGNANNIEDTTNFTRKGIKEKFIVVYPYGTGRLRFKLLTWNCGFCCGYALENNIDDIGYIRSLYDYIESEYLVNSSMVYATGISNGGIMAYRVGAELSDIFAAIAPVAAQIGGQATEDDELWQIPEPDYPVSVIAFNGMKDTRVPYDGGKPIEGNAHVYSWMSTNDSISFWVDQNKCNTTPERNVSESGNIIIDTYNEGLDNTEVVLVTIVDGGHSWPGGKKGWAGGPEPTLEINATDIIWDFFKNHPKN